MKKVRIHHSPDFNTCKDHVFRDFPVVRCRCFERGEAIKCECGQMMVCKVCEGDLWKASEQDGENNQKALAGLE